MSGTVTGSLDASVIVPIYNAEQFLDSCLASLQQLDGDGLTYEVICVDNGSTDGTAAILRRFGQFRVLQEAKRGAGAARNAGVRAAAGKFLAFTDADCIVSKGWLKSLLRPLLHGGACAVGGRILARPGAGAVERFGEIVHDHERAVANLPPYLIGMNFALSKELFEAAGGFDERWLRSQDSEFSFRLFERGCQFLYAGDAVVWHHNRSTLKQLFREGFLHGYYGAELFRIYSALRERCDVLAAERPEFRPKDIPPALASIPAWQLNKIRAVFKLAKRVGWSVGTWRAPASLRPAGSDR